MIRFLRDKECCEGITNVNGDEFEEAVLSKNGYNDFMTCLGVVIKEGNSASMGLDKEFGGVVKGCGGVLA